MRIFVAALSLVLVSEAASEESIPRIRSIVVEPQPIFDDDDRIEDGLMAGALDFVFDTANVLHIDTREHVIRRELLFSEGDPADPVLLAESERNLRDLDIVRQVRIVTRSAGPGLVDVIVRTQDTWTTEPRASFSLGGGNETSEVGVVEKNLFGFGKRVVARYQSEIDRDSIQLAYEDPRLVGSRWNLGTNFEETSDGRVLQGGLVYPFFSLTTPFSGGIRYSSIRDRGRIFAVGEDEILEFGRKSEVFEAFLAALLPWSDPSSVVFRAGPYYRWSEERFSFVDGEDALVPADQRRSIVGLTYERQEVRFVEERHLSRFDRVEDLNIGNLFQARLGYSVEGLGAREDEPILTVSDRQGFDLGPGRKVFLFGLATGRSAGGEVRNGVLELEAIAFNRVRLFLEQTFVLRAKIDIGTNLDRQFQLFLGNDNGLRGVPTRQLVGEKRLIVNFEDRIFFVNDFLSLLSLGAVVFVDAGNVWATRETIRPEDLGVSVGFGLRIGAPRSAGEKIWRFDFAFPLNRIGGESFGIDFSFGSGQAFQPFQGPFELQTTGG